MKPQIKFATSCIKHIPAVTAEAKLRLNAEVCVDNVGSTNTNLFFNQGIGNQASVSDTLQVSATVSYILTTFGEFRSLTSTVFSRSSKDGMLSVRTVVINTAAGRLYVVFRYLFIPSQAPSQFMA